MFDTSGAGGSTLLTWVHGTLLADAPLLVQSGGTLWVVLMGNKSIEEDDEWHRK